MCSDVEDANQLVAWVQSRGVDAGFLKSIIPWDVMAFPLEEELWSLMSEACENQF